MCSLFSPLPVPDAPSQGTEHFGMVSPERHEDGHCTFPFWNGVPTTCIPNQKMHPGSIAPAAPSVPSSPWVFSCTLSSSGRGGWSGCRESRASPGGAHSCLPCQGEGVGGHGAIA